MSWSEITMAPNGSCIGCIYLPCKSHVLHTRVPESAGRGRFGNWLANARDWNISRNRYWGTPIPLWVSKDMTEVGSVVSLILALNNKMTQIVCVSSIQELESLSGVTNLSDLHRESIDQITIPSKQGKGALRRIEEVFDCWFESGRYCVQLLHLSVR